MSQQEMIIEPKNIFFPDDMASTWGRAPDGSHQNDLLTLMDLPEYAYVSTIHQMLPVFAQLGF
jgi:hypothetical protein